MKETVEKFLYELVMEQGVSLEDALKAFGEEFKRAIRKTLAFQANQIMQEVFNNAAPKIFEVNSICDTAVERFMDPQMHDILTPLRRRATMSGH